MMENRGQTTQDYILGVSIMLVTTLFIFGYLPNVYDSFNEPVDGVDHSQADRAASVLVENYSIEGSRTTLKFEEPGGINRTLSNESGFQSFRERAGLDSRTDRIARPDVNVRLINSSEMGQSGSPDPIVEGGHEYSYGDTIDENRSVATSKRIVRLNESTPTHCQPTCWLLVRIG